MTERKFTDEEVIRALELHSEALEPCLDKCVYGKERYCGSKMAKDALDLINRQRAVIEALTKTSSKKNVKFNTGDYAKIASDISGHEFKIGTIVKLEKFDDDYKAYANGDYWWVTDDDLIEIDSLTEELTEGKPCTEDADCSTCENCYHDGGYNECRTDGVK